MMKKKEQLVYISYLYFCMQLDENCRTKHLKKNAIQAHFFLLTFEHTNLKSWQIKLTANKTDSELGNFIKDENVKWKLLR